MTAAQAEAIRAILAASLPVFEAREAARRAGNPAVEVDPKDLDFASTYDNTVETYSDVESQWVYMNMYLAKHIGVWRWFRRRVPVQAGAPVVSIGAGPNCCLWGWFLDQPPAPGTHVHAVDPLPWDGVLAHTSAHDVNTALFVGAHYARHTRYFPPGVAPYQLARVGPVEPLAPTNVPAGAVVLMPFVLNHLIGRIGHVGDLTPVVDWLRDLQTVASRIVIVDLPAARSPDFWPGLLERLGFAVESRTPPTISFQREAAEVSALYPDRYKWRSRRSHGGMTTASAVVWTGTSWWTVGQGWPQTARGLTWG